MSAQKLIAAVNLLQSFSQHEWDILIDKLTKEFGAPSEANVREAGGLHTYWIKGTDFVEASMIDSGWLTLKATVTDKPNDPHGYGSFGEAAAKDTNVLKLITKFSAEARKVLRSLAGDDDPQAIALTKLLSRLCLSFGR